MIENTPLVTTNATTPLQQHFDRATEEVTPDDHNSTIIEKSPLSSCNSPSNLIIDTSAASSPDILLE